jgi:hypothetical protein
MDVRVVYILLAGWVGSNVGELGAEIALDADTVFEVAGMPDYAVARGGMRVTAFDELDAACGGLVEGRGDEDVDVVGHDDEAVEQESLLVAIVEECCDKKFGVLCLLEMAMLAKR